MRNDTKIKLHLSKQLFESLTKQVLAEGSAKGNMGGGAYTEAVKQPKQPKQPGQSNAPKSPKPTSEAPKKHAAKPKMSEGALLEDQSQLISAIMDALRDPQVLGMIATAIGMVVGGKKLAKSIQDDPESRKNIDDMTGAGS